MTLAAVEVQNGFLVTFKSLLNHLSTSLRPNPSLILHMARSAGAGGGEASISKLASRSASLSRQSLPRKCWLQGGKRSICVLRSFVRS